MRFHRRLLATMADAVLGLLVALALAPTPLGHYFASRAVVLLRIGQADSWFQGPVPMIIGMFGELVFLLPSILALVLLPEGISGRSPGKRICGVRIVAGAPGGLVGRYLVKTMPLWLSVLALVSGVWVVEQAALAWGLVLLVGWLIPTLIAGPAIHERVTGTRLERV